MSPHPARHFILSWSWYRSVVARLAHLSSKLQPIDANGLGGHKSNLSQNQSGEWLPYCSSPSLRCIDCFLSDFLIPTLLCCHESLLLCCQIVCVGMFIHERLLLGTDLSIIMFGQLRPALRQSDPRSRG